MRVYQIYFKPEQLPELQYIPYLNQNCTVFFENTVIKDLVLIGEHAQADYFGVVSYKLKQKIDVTKNWGNVKIANTSVKEFTPAAFEHELLKHQPDAMSFQRHVPHDPISVANRYHPNFSKYWQHILSANGYQWTPTLFNNIFYCNYFVAKSDLYEKYVKEMLIPCMNTMEGMPELLLNSHYPHKLPVTLAESFGVNHYPYHTFICERMFSFFAHIHNLKCLSF